MVDIVNRVNPKRLTLETRISCPYSTEQYNPQQAEWAKANKELLVPDARADRLARDAIVELSKV